MANPAKPYESSDEESVGDFCKQFVFSSRGLSVVQDSAASAGLSKPLYLLLHGQIRNRLSRKVHKDIGPAIAYVGRDGSTRTKILDQYCKLDDKFYLSNTQGRPAGQSRSLGDLMDLQNIREKVSQGSDISKFDFTFLPVFQRLKSMVERSASFQIHIYTEMKSDGVIYHADPLSCFGGNPNPCGAVAGGWNDWAMFEYRIRNKRWYYPGQLYGFVVLDEEAVRLFNDSCEQEEDHVELDRPPQPQAFAITQLARNPLIGFYNPKQGPVDEEEHRKDKYHVEDGVERVGQDMQPNSSLLFWERKAVDRSGNPKTLLVSISSIYGPLLAYQDFCPKFNMDSKAKEDYMQVARWRTNQEENAYIFVRPRYMWADVLLARARESYQQDLSKEEREEAQKGLAKEIGTTAADDAPARAEKRRRT